MPTGGEGTGLLRVVAKDHAVLLRWMQE